MTQMTKLREEMAALLRTAGIAVREAFPVAARRESREPFVLLSLKEMESMEGGFLSYLGERYCVETQEYEEVYGRKLRLCFGLDVYAPKAKGAEGGQALMEQIGDLVTTQAPLGLSGLRLSWGEATFEKGADLFRREGKLFAEGLLYLLREEGGRFLSFEVKGGITLG